MARDREGSREAWKVWGPLAGLAIVGFAVTLLFLEPPPPRTFSLAAGSAGGAYHAFAERYREALAEEGYELRVVETAGSVENLAKVRAGEVDLALLQGGVVGDADLEGTEALASVFLEPVWILTRSELELSGLDDLEGLRVSIGEAGSGTRTLALDLLADLGLDRANALQTVELGSPASLEALEAGEIDAAFLVSSAQADWVEGALASPSTKLLPIRRQQAFEVRHRFLIPLTLGRGVVDLPADLPDRDVPMLAAAASLAARPDLPDSLVPLIVEVLEKVHGNGGLLEAPGQFPSARWCDLPVRSQARHYLEKGPSFLYRVLPFWAAAMANRLKILLVPLLTLLFPLFKAAPPLYRWRIRSKIYRWYEDLKVVDDALVERLPPEELADRLERLERIEREVIAEVSVPLSYMDELYRLREHIHLVLRQLEEQQDEANEAGDSGSLTSPAARIEDDERTAPGGDPGTATSGSRRPGPFVAGVLVFLAALAVLGPVLASLPALVDTDSSYHLAIARLYREHGFVDRLPWTRLSVFAEDFGDKELLFHVLLAPFTGLGDDPTTGGRLALAAAIAGLLGLTTGLAWRWVGPWSLLVPLLQLASLDLLSRWIRLRPELLSLALLLIAVALAGRGRFRWLGVVSFVYSLSYTAFHVLPGFCGLLFVHRAVVRGRREPALVLWPLLGSLLGLLAHPAFPANLVVWKIQNVDFFRWKDRLDVGREIGSPDIGELVVGSGPWLAATLLAILLLCGRGLRDGTADEDDRDAFGLAALVFGVLWLAMGRMAVYGVPFATLAGFAWATGRRRLDLPPGWRPAIACALVAGLGIGLFRTGAHLERLTEARGALSRTEDWRGFSAALPQGARVAAEWGTTALYMLWAPQATYLNVLDPIFMAIRFPDAYRKQRLLFTDREPDPALALRRDLDSEWIALSLFHQPASLVQRLEDDPRFARRHAGYTMLWQLDPAGADRFVTDWVVVERWDPAVPDRRERRPVPYPRLSDEGFRRIEGFVDLDRIVPRGSCARLVHRAEEDPEIAGDWTVRATVPLSLRIGPAGLRHPGDDRPAVALAEAPAPVVAVEACSTPGERRPGFSLLRPAR